MPSSAPLTFLFLPFADANFSASKCASATLNFCMRSFRAASSAYDCSFAFTIRCASFRRFRFSFLKSASVSGFFFKSFRGTAFSSAETRGRLKALSVSSGTVSKCAAASKFSTGLIRFPSASSQASGPTNIVCLRLFPPVPIMCNPACSFSVAAASLAMAFRTCARSCPFITAITSGSRAEPASIRVAFSLRWIPSWTFERCIPV
mmetsp:Transcript_17496/g.34830  ORF Transcript_17496/g.34830 Transcript_17496/m.34830 type:complete len:205 (+) Transcript_17496:519-1133(+)